MDIMKTINTVGSKIRDYGFPKEAEEELKKYYSFFAERDDLKELLKCYYSKIFIENAMTHTEVEQLPENDGLEEGKLFALLYLVRLETIDDDLNKRGIPRDFKKQMVCQYTEKMEKNHEMYNSYGFCGMYRSFMINHLTLKIFTLGRLTFEISKFDGPYVVYESKESNRYIPIAKNGYKYFCDGTRTPFKYEGEAFEPMFCEIGGEICGYTFTEEGILNFESVKLKIGEYKKVLSEGDNILSVHIPAEGKLSAETVEDAFFKAEDFFEAYFPEIQPKAYVCSSWLLDTAMAKLLKPNSNILRFQNFFKIVLSSVNDYSLYWHIFGIQKIIPMSELEPKNSFQKKILDWLSGGGTLHNGSGFIIRK